MVRCPESILGNRQRRSQLWRIPSSGGEPARISPLEIRLPVASPDGKYIYLAAAGARSGSLWRIAPDGSGEQEVLSRAPAFKFVPAAGGVYLIRSQDAGQTSVILFHSFDSGEERVIATLPFTATAAGLDLSPDGKTLLYAPIEQTDGDLMSVQLIPP